MAIRPPAPPYLGPPAHSSGTANKPINRVVIHSTVSPCEAGQARKIAAYFRSPSAGGSAHYVVDPEETVQAAYDSVVCWHAPPNGHSLGVEMCEYPNQDIDRWDQPNHVKLLDRTARLTARLCLAYGVPIQFLMPEDLRAGKRGITTHNNVSQAWHESTHWDPGAWPRERFMQLVNQHAARIKEKAADQ